MVRLISGLMFTAACTLGMSAVSVAADPVDADPLEVYGAESPAIPVYQAAYRASVAARADGAAIRDQVEAARAAISDMDEVDDVRISDSGTVLLIVLSNGMPMEFELIPMAGDKL